MNVMCVWVQKKCKRIGIERYNGGAYTIVSGVRSGNNAVSVVAAATVVGVGGDVRGVRDGSERIHVYDI